MSATVVAVVIGGALTLCLVKTFSSTPEPQHQWQLNQLGRQRTTELEMDDESAPRDRFGAHHLAKQFGTGALCMTKEVTDFIATS